MKKMMLILIAVLLLSGCSGTKEKAACTISQGNNTVTITEGRDISSGTDGQMIRLKQTIQIDSQEEDVLVIYREFYEKELQGFASDEKVKTSVTETETGFLVTIEFDVKNMTPSSRDHMMELLETETLDADLLLNQMKESGFTCGDEDAEEELNQNEEIKDEAESK